VFLPPCCPGPTLPPCPTWISLCIHPLTPPGLGHHLARAQERERDRESGILGRWVYLSSPLALKDTTVPSHSLFLLRLFLGYPRNSFWKGRGFARSIPVSGLHESARGAFYWYIYECFEERHRISLQKKKKGAREIGAKFFPRTLIEKRSCEKHFTPCPFWSFLGILFRVLPGFVTFRIFRRIIPTQWSHIITPILYILLLLSISYLFQFYFKIFQRYNFTFLA